MDELDKVADYYKYSDDWKNRLVQGDSLLVMTSLLEQEGMAGKVQTIYFDPPYGIKYGGNWQMNINDRSMPYSEPDEAISREPEMIKAFRDTWIDGIHTYLSYLRDRLIIAKELLTESGSCFVQISDENVHLVRALMDEVFGSENFVSQITFTKTAPLGSSFLPNVCDYILFYSKNHEQLKYRPLFEKKPFGKDTGYQHVVLPDATKRPLSKEEKEDLSILPIGSELFNTGNLMSSGATPTCIFDLNFGAL
jgi:adenine-specific DNA-methyltransferase